MQQKNKAISYSLFGYGKKTPENCFEYNSYFRGLVINIRLARLIYPDWIVVLHIDNESYKAFEDFLNELPIKIVICEEAELTKAMLWRMKPCFESYEAVLCRDIDSPLTYREAQAVYYWLSTSKCVHAITDSVSHNVPMMGGMIGFKPKHFTATCGYSSWDEMISSSHFDWSIKGSDQDFLNQHIYRKYSQIQNDSITQHYIKGIGHTYLSDYHNEIQDLKMPNVPKELNESNDICGHIGSSGWYETALFKFLRKHWHSFDDLLELEKKHSNIFYWVNE
jgi:hypothetical protein